jgi:hypothetical protein
MVPDLVVVVAVVLATVVVAAVEVDLAPAQVVVVAAAATLQQALAPLRRVAAELEAPATVAMAPFFLRHQQTRQQRPRQSELVAASLGVRSTRPQLQTSSAAVLVGPAEVQEVHQAPAQRMHQAPRRTTCGAWAVLALTQPAWVVPMVLTARLAVVVAEDPAVRTAASLFTH